VHSKKSTADEILAFCKEWDNRCPLVIVPTRYYATPTERFREANVSLVIWANHNLRAAISAMREASRTIREDESLLAVEERIARLGEVFALAGNAEMEEAERRYLGERRIVRAVILAATRGSALGELTRERPKCMLDVRGKSLLQRQVDALAEHGVAPVTVVAGYRPDAIDVSGVSKVVNEAHESTGEVASLARARDALDGECVVGYGDILYRGFLLTAVLGCQADVVLVVDADPSARRAESGRTNGDLVRCSVPFTSDLTDDTRVVLEAFGAPAADADGKFIGLLKLSQRGALRVRDELDAMMADGSGTHADLAELLTRLVAAGEKPSIVYVTGNWLDVNDVFDLARARNVS
jgi:phosphoenolpyruvate phosphomutase